MKNKGAFCELFGCNPRNRILEFFLEMRELDFSIGDISKELNLNRATTYNTMDGLIANKFIMASRVVSGGQLYKLNINKKEVIILIQVFNLILEKVMKKHNEKVVYA